MRAIIIAAGVGSRLYPLTQSTPKSLLDIGEGLSILDSQLYSLGENGIKDVTIISGYLVKQIEAKAEIYKNKFNISIAYNPFFEVSNNLVSVWMARQYMNEDFITINGDDIFQPVVIENLLKSKNKITMVVDKKDTYDDDDMKVIVKNGLVQKVSKKIPLVSANGESVGIIKFAGKGKEVYIKTLEKMVRQKQYINSFYLQAIQLMINEGYNIHTSECNANEWHELDFPEDLEFIRNYVKQTDMVSKIMRTK